MVLCGNGRKPLPFVFEHSKTVENNEPVVLNIPKQLKTISKNNFFLLCLERTIKNGIQFRPLQTSSVNLS